MTMEKVRTIEDCSVTCIFENGILKGIIKKDMVSRKNLIYLVKEANCNDIAEFISNNE